MRFLPTGLLTGLLAFAAPAFSLGQETVYRNDFTQPAGPEWLLPGPNNPDNGWLGTFGGHEPAILTLQDLPPHDALLLEVKFRLKGSWDGDSEKYGPDSFRIHLDGVPLLDRTFTSGAKTYRLETPHSATTAVFRFGSEQTDLEKERWALMDLTVRALGTPASPELVSIELIGAESDRMLYEIEVGESFRVRLTYAEEPSERISESVTVRTTSGEVMRIEVSGGDRVVVSDPILIGPLVRP